MKSVPLWLLAALLGCSVASAETYRSVPLSKLKFEDPKEEMAAILAQQVDSHQLRLLDARLKTECYLTYDDPEVGELPQNLLRLVFKGDDKLPISGALELSLDYAGTNGKTFRFSIVEGSANEIGEEDFIKARKAWAEVRADSRIPGSAWFRHQAGHGEGREGAVSAEEVMDTLGIFSGGRAISDNLALDRDLILGRGEKDEMIRIDTIEGVTVKAIDWSKQMPAGEVLIDPLALAIPDDQHAIFAPSLPGLLKLMNQLEQEAIPLVGMISSDSPYHGLLKRYRRQLGMDMSDAAALLLPVRSVAVTGGDPYFATGTDVAILMETRNAAALLKALELAVQTQAGAPPKRHNEKNLERLSFVIPEKGISSHLCRIGDLVFVTNSMAQVHRLAEVSDQRAPALGKTDEFKVFRSRYPKGDEHAFVFLSDATIRRWAGPVTRIGASRRNRALAALNELTCRNIIACGKDDDYSAMLGRTAMLNGRAISEHFGSAEFLTPISELGLTEVTGLEKEAYEQWRRGYESGWRQVFDPIAIQLKLDDQSAHIDLTVLPLNINSDFQEIMAITGKAKLTPRARLRPEGSIMRLACAVDSESEIFKEFDQELVSILPELKIKPLSWVGESVSLDFLDSLYWQGLGQMGIDSHLAHLPVVGRIEVKSKIKLGLFLTAMRTMMQTSAPDAMKWVNRKHGERTYVVIEQQDGDEFSEQIRICYAIVGDALLITLNERNLKQVMDLEVMEISDEQIGKLPQAKSLMLDVDPAVLGIIDQMERASSMRTRQAGLSWNAIPILNEWRRLYPDRDPLEVHQSLFGVSIVCPGGKGYRWNEEHLTMESVAYGHRGALIKPAGDKQVPADPMAGQRLVKYGRMHSGIDFEDEGLRLRLHLGPKTPLPALPQPEIGAVLGKGEELIAYKVGRVLSYEGMAEYGPHSWKQEVLSMEKTPEGVVVSTSEPWSDEEDEGKWSGKYLIAKNGVWRVGGKDEFNTSTYIQMPLELPAELRLNQTHHNQVIGQDIYEENGEKEIEGNIERESIRVLGTETIEVKAGKFENCVVVERRTESLWGDYFELNERKEWYHPGTGLIRTIDDNGLGSDLIKIEQK